MLSSTQETNKLLFFDWKITSRLPRIYCYVSVCSSLQFSLTVVPMLSQWSTDKEKLCKINSWKCFNLDHDFDKSSNITSPFCWTVVLCRSSASVITRVVYWEQFIPSFSRSCGWLVGPPWRLYRVAWLKHHVHLALDNCRRHCHKVNRTIQRTSKLEAQGNV